MNQGIIAVILSIIFYLTSLLGGSGTQQTTPNHQFSKLNSRLHPASWVSAVTLGDNIPSALAPM